MEKTIYNLELHESLSQARGQLTVTRVPGGWLYEHWRFVRGSDGDYEPYAVTFVPFDNEFQDKTDPAMGF